MVRFVFLAICLLPIAVLTPILEIGPTHVFNPSWPGHARLHEVWQLITHCSIAALALGLAWTKGQMRLASLLGLLVNSAFLAAVLLAPAYGGTMRHSDGTEIALGGVNLAVAIMVAATIGLLGLYLDDRMKDVRRAALDKQER